jgi:hypothetical protein
VRSIAPDGRVFYDRAQNLDTDLMAAH